MVCKSVPVSVPVSGGEKCVCSVCSTLPLGSGTTGTAQRGSIWERQNTVTLRLPYPVSANRYWRHVGHKVVRSAAAKQYCGAIAVMAMREGFRPTSEAVEVGIRLLPKLTKKGQASEICLDLSNAWKVAEDALQGLLFENDRQVRRIEADFGDPVESGGLIVAVALFNG
jgi:crossover junction endodeoxyribonuclease RusA